MLHGGDIYTHRVDLDFSVSLNPLGTPEAIRAALTDCLPHLSEYPDPEQRAVRAALAESDGVLPEEILAGNGASELIFAVTGMLRPRRVRLLEPGFYGYRHALRQLPDCEIVEVHTPDPADYLRDPAELVTGTDLLYLADPWNPGGKNTDPSKLVEILAYAARAGVSVLLDESFYLLSDAAADGHPRSVAEWLAAYDGLFVIRSCTKVFALPGVRMGYVLSAPGNIKRLKKHLPEWNLSVTADRVLTAGAALVKEGSFVKDSVSFIRTERAYLTAHLRALGLHVYESNSVYLLLEADRDLFEALLARGILIRIFDGPSTDEMAENVDAASRKDRCLCRIAVRSHTDNVRLIKEIGEIV